MIPYFKMRTNKKSGITTITNLKDGSVKTFTLLSAALLYIEIYRQRLCPKARGHVAGEPYPVRSLVPNI